MKVGAAMGIVDLPMPLRIRGRSLGENKCGNEGAALLLLGEGHSRPNDIVRDPGEKYGSMYPYLWTVRPFQNLVKSHLALIERISFPIACLTAISAQQAWRRQRLAQDFVCEGRRYCLCVGHTGGRRRL